MVSDRMDKTAKPIPTLNEAAFVKSPEIKKNSALSHGAGDEDRRQECLRTNACVLGDC